MSELIITEESDDNRSIRENRYEYEMIAGNNIPAFLSLREGYDNTKKEYIYDITSMLSLKELADRKPIGYLELCLIIDSLKNCREKVDEYLLSSDGLILNPEYIFLDPYNKCLRFCIYPDYSTDLFISYTSLAEFILSAIDYEEEDTVKLAYEIYAAVLDKNYEFEKMADMRRYREYLDESLSEKESDTKSGIESDEETGMDNNKYEEQDKSYYECDAYERGNTDNDGYVKGRMSRLSLFCIICLIIAGTMIMTAFLVNRRLLLAVIKNRKYATIIIMTLSLMMFVPVMNFIDLKRR